MKITNYLFVGLLLATGPSFSQETNKKPPVKATLEDFEEPPSWDVTCEVFSLPLSEAAKLKRAKETDAQDYAELLKRVETDKATLEEFLMLRAREGQNTTAEEISEMIYATEYEPPELPNEIGNLVDDIEKAKALVTPASPTSFDTKKVGSTFEVELTVDEENAVEVQCSLTFVSYLGNRTWGQEMAEAEMPKFGVQRIMTGLTITPDSPTLIGSISPPEALQPKKGERLVWLAYVTVSKSKD